MTELIIPDPRFEMPSLFYPGRKPVGDVIINPEHFLSKKSRYTLWLTRHVLESKNLEIVELGTNTIKGGDIKLGNTTFDAFNMGDPGVPNVWCQIAILTINTTSNSAIAGMAEFHGDSIYDRHIAINSGVFIGYLFDGATKTLSGTTSVSVGTQYIVVAQTDGSTFWLYVNGILENSISVSNGGFTGYATPELFVGSGGVSIVASLVASSHTIKFYAFLNEILTSQEIMSLSRNPYQFLIPAT